MGTGNDPTVTQTVAALRDATNEFTHELHDGTRLEAAQIQEAIMLSGCKVVVIASHGRDDALLDASQERKAYVQQSQSAIFSATSVFSHACLTALRLGEACRHHSYVFVGFDDLAAAPPSSNDLSYADALSIYRTIFNYLQSGDGNEDVDRQVRAQSFLEDVFELADTIQGALVDDAGGSLLSADELIFFQQFKRDIVAWPIESDSALKAESAEPFGMSEW